MNSHRRENNTIFSPSKTLPTPLPTIFLLPNPISLPHPMQEERGEREVFSEFRILMIWAMWGILCDLSAFEIERRSVL